jgi:hypothetical protein
MTSEHYLSIKKQVFKLQGLRLFSELRQTRELHRQLVMNKLLHRQLVMNNLSMRAETRDKAIINCAQNIFFLNLGPLKIILLMRIIYTKVQARKKLTRQSL